MRNRIVFGLISMTLIFSLAFSGCGTDGGSTDDPALEGTVSIIGAAAVGQMLFANTDSLQGEGAISYLWKRGNTAEAAGTAIDGATSAIYILVAADAGKYITVTVTRTGYSGNKTSAAVRLYVIGDTGPGGGKIFYVSAGFTNTLTGVACHYLEAAPADMSTTLAWASSTDSIPGTQTHFGTGAANTVAILALDPNAPAAKACKDYRGGGKTDWFLPSKDELNEIFNNKTLLSCATTSYWSSSDSGGAWAHVFSTGQQYNYQSKINVGCVRAIRAF
ncbi:hypothetical protein FACS189462_3160 [Spirochaetia bacterium]|nr:hypothetical protein FACS189462_3160 [Spirochaetia bacterium]